MQNLIKQKFEKPADEALKMLPGMDASLTLNT